MLVAKPIHDVINHLDALSVTTNALISRAFKRYEKIITGKDHLAAPIVTRNSLEKTWKTDNSLEGAS